MKRKGSILIWAALVCGLMAAALFGCGRTILSGKTPIAPEQPPERATTINLVIAAKTDAGLQNVRVKAVGPIPRDTTLSGPSGATQMTLVLGSLIPLEQGAYEITVRRTGYTIQNVLVILEGEDVPTRGVYLTKKESGSTMVVSPPQTITAVQSTTPTTITVAQPPVVQAVVAAVAPAEVTVTGVVGDVTVTTQAPMDVPSVVQNNVVQQSVLGAVSIDAPATPGATVTVKLPVPLLDVASYAAATGGKVGILKFNFETLTWTKIGEAEIGADGIATATVTGLGEETLIAIGKIPTVTTAPAVQTEVQTIDSDEVEALKDAGETTFPYDLAPTVDISGPTPKAARPQLSRPAQGAIPASIPEDQRLYWAMVAAKIAEKVPALAQWCQSGLSGGAITLPALAAQIKRLKIQEVFEFTFRFGNASRVITVNLDYTRTQAFLLGHGSGGGGGE